MSVREVKVCLLGVSKQYTRVPLLYFRISQDIGVGKTSLVGRFVHDTFSQNITTTLG